MPSPTLLVSLVAGLVLAGGVNHANKLLTNLAHYNYWESDLFTGKQYKSCSYDEAEPRAWASQKQLFINRLADWIESSNGANRKHDFKADFARWDLLTREVRQREGFPVTDADNLLKPEPAPVVVAPVSLSSSTVAILTSTSTSTSVTVPMEPEVTVSQAAPPPQPTVADDPSETLAWLKAKVPNLKFNPSRAKRRWMFTKQGQVGTQGEKKPTAGFADYCYFDGDGRRQRGNYAAKDPHTGVVNLDRFKYRENVGVREDKEADKEAFLFKLAQFIEMNGRGESLLTLSRMVTVLKPPSDNLRKSAI